MRPDSRNDDAQDFLHWCERREAALRDPDGWLSLVDLLWLTPGTRLTVGSDPACDLHLAEAPARLGTLEVSHGAVLWHPEEGPSLTLQSDAQGAPTVIRWGRHSFFVIEREGGLALRVKDRAAAALTTFSGIERFPQDPAWCIEARWQSGRAVFEHGGLIHELVPQNPDADPLHFVIADAGSGTETYGGGRFLYAAKQEDDRLVLDFNRAINPPCVFTPYATCPLPPAGNRLPFSITAGEKWQRA